MVEKVQSSTRRSGRIYAAIPVEVVVDSEGGKISYPGSTLDFSTLGARIQTEVTLTPGQQVNVIWQGQTPRSLQSRVVWSNAGRPERGAEVGLQFLRPLDVAA